MSHELMGHEWTSYEGEMRGECFLSEAERVSVTLEKDHE